MCIDLKIDDWYKLHKTRKAFEITIHEGYTALVGKNGSGKSTILQQIKLLLSEDKNIQLVEYNNLSDGGSIAKSKYLSKNMLSQLATSFYNSEGQDIIHNFGVFIASGLRKKIIEADGKKTVILLDSLDSGTSIDMNIRLREIFDCIIKDAKEHNAEVYIIAAVNNYEIVKDTDAIDVTTGHHMTFFDYETYKSFICKNMKKEDKK